MRDAGGDVRLGRPVRADPGAEFVICLGYKGYLIKEYFANYYLHACDVSFDLAKGDMEVHRSETEPWRVTLVDTGEQTMTGGRLKRVLPYVGEEDFVTAVLVQIARGGELTIVNCGHHPPLLRHCGDLQPLTGGKAALPLGLEDNFTAFTASWSPGDRLLLYTDGLVESRDRHGEFLPEDEIAAALFAADCDQALDTLITAVHRHTGGHGHDDMALLLLEHSAPPRSSAHGQPAAAQTAGKTVAAPRYAATSQ